MKTFKAICKLSGVTFTSNELPDIGEFAAPSIHPIFFMDEKVVRTLADKVFTTVNEDNQTLTHLVGTYYLHKLPIDRWELPLLMLWDLETFQAFWLKNLEALVGLVSRMESLGKTFNAVKHMPHFAVTVTSRDSLTSLRNLKDWITEAHVALNEATQPITEEARKRNRQLHARLEENTYFSEAHQQEIIMRGLKGSLLSRKEANAFPELIANWAATVGEFPQTNLRLPSGKRTTLRTHWINILQKAFQANGAGLLDLLSDDVTLGDIEEILEHCTCNIPNDTTHAILFFKELGQLHAALEEYKMPAKQSTATLLAMLGEVSPVEQTPKAQENIDPNAPKKEDFPSLASYMKAKIAYARTKDANEAKKAAQTIITDIRVEL